LSAILNEEKQIVTVIAGAPENVMRHGIPRVRELYEVSVSEPLDLIIALPGRYPNGINLCQVQFGNLQARLDMYMWY
jgi:nickel-dependent lactate racemase